MGRSFARGDRPEGDGARLDRSLRHQADQVSRRGLPSHRHGAPAGIGAPQGRRPCRCDRDRRSPLGPRARAPERAGRARDAASAPRPGDGCAAGGDARRRDRPPGPLAGRARPGARLPDRARGDRCRHRRRRSRPRRSRCSRLRGLGGPADDRARRRRRRRPGRLELADPQLPRLPTRARWRRARPARLPAGVALRHPLPADGARRPARASRRRLRRRHGGRG